MAGYNTIAITYVCIYNTLYICYATCNRGDNYGGGEGAVPWELGNVKFQVGCGVGEARWDVKA